MVMKKLLCALLCLAFLTAGLAACGSDSDSYQEIPSPGADVTVAATLGEETTAQPGAAEQETVVPDRSVLAQEFRGHYYRYFVHPVSWAEADVYCRNLGGHLVTISDAAENEFVRLMMQNGGYGEAWIGSNDIGHVGTYTWVTGEPFTYSNWSPGEPNNGGGVQHYAYMLNRDRYIGVWDDAQGSPLAKGGFVCEWEPGAFAVKPDLANMTQYNGHMYQCFPERITWEAALVTCQRMGGHLVTLQDAAESAFVLQLMGGGAETWIGASDILKGSNNFEWITGEPFQYSNWRPGEPQGRTCEDVALLKPDGAWIDEGTGLASITWYVCEWENFCVTEAGVSETHTFGDWETVKEAACGVKGERTHTCTLCGAAEAETLPALTHQFGEWVETTPATCGVAGQSTRTCALCGDTESQLLPALEHHYGLPEVASAATCSKTGLEIRTCPLCGDTIETEIPKLEHQYGAYQTVSGSALIPPIVKQQTCTLCGHAETAEDWSYVWVPILVAIALIGVVIGVVNYAKAFKRR